ncbi:hypothetical protein HN51_050924, partial [Arachis hypogaea]
DKKKEFVPTNAAFYSLGADLFLSQRKIKHIARFVGVPSISIPGDVPSILIVNIQVAAYFLVQIELQLRISYLTLLGCKFYVRHLNISLLMFVYAQQFFILLYDFP